MSNYRDHYSSRETPQGEAIPGEKMVRNNAGGFAFDVGRWTQLERFLILGSEEGTYYVGERAHTIDNAQSVLECIKEDGRRVVGTVAAISKAGRAPKNDPALFVLAMCAGLGDEATRQAAFDVLPQVARIGTHLLHFANYMEGFRGWGRAARRGIGNWFLGMHVEKLGYQFLKYAQRDGWSMRDLLRLSHPETNDEARNALFKHIVGKETEVGQLPAQVQAALSLGDDSPVGYVVGAILEHNLPREAIPTKFLNDPAVWEALLQNMPMTALIRNVGKMSQVGLLAPLSAASQVAAEKILDQDALQRARIHPINVLAAQVIYAQGQGFRGKNAWTPVPQITDALDEAFYASFKYAEPANKRTLIGLDVSGSMTGHPVNGMPFLNARTASAVMAMFVARTEKRHYMMGFTGDFIPLNISPRMRLDDIVKNVSRLPFGRTDCAQPMLWALENRAEVDTFIIYTDNETWCGRIHPVQALQQYRERLGIPAKLVTCALAATRFSIGKATSGRFSYGDPNPVADPNDGGMLDVAGLDSAAPQIISDFSRA